MRKRGFTLIELLAVIVILAVIALIATPIILGIIDDTKKSAFKDSVYGISQAAKNAFVEIMYAGGEPKDITYTYTNGVETSDPSDYSLNYEGDRPKNGQVSLTKEGQVSLVLHDGKYCVTKGYNAAEVTIEEISWSECEAKISEIINIVIVPEYDASKGVNRPKLTKGMTPIKWNGTTWVETTTDDSDWYSYNSTDKKWANAKTIDGSMWVWIPRYAYQIATGYHTSTAGTINIKFLQDTSNNTSDSTTIYEDNASNTHFVKHPAFTFGNAELTGIWVAKFEATAVEGVANGYRVDGTCALTSDDVTTKTIKVGPNAQSWRCISVSNVFTTVRNMETKNIYGWTTASGLKIDGTFTTDNNGIDTHLMRNSEWGVVAYLSKSQYGQNTEEIYINNSQTFTTGCAGSTVSASAYDGCQNAYNTTGGIKASTTGNIYGIYDMSGGSWERVSAYINNGNSNLTDNGASIINAIAKYKDVYSVGSTDDSATNYGLTNSFKGDAIYETSSAGTGSVSWFSDYSSMPATSGVWFIRGSHYVNGTNVGIYAFNSAWGVAALNGSFRPVLVVNAGL